MGICLLERLEVLMKVIRSVGESEWHKHKSIYPCSDSATQGHSVAWARSGYCPIHNRGHKNCGL